MISFSCFVTIPRLREISRQSGLWEKNKTKREEKLWRKDCSLLLISRAWSRFFLEIAVGQTANTAIQFLQVAFILYLILISDFFDNKVYIFGTEGLNTLLGFFFFNRKFGFRLYCVFWILGWRLQCGFIRFWWFVYYSSSFTFETMNFSYVKKKKKIPIVSVVWHDH